MAYTPINWQNGDTITADKMNKMDNGWSIDTASTTLCSESVTTTGGFPPGQLAYSEWITADTIWVTFDGVEYECPRLNPDDEEWCFYGGYDTDLGEPDYSVFPFWIDSENTGANYVDSENIGTHTISIAAVTQTLETSTDFQRAVNSITTFNINDINGNMDKTLGEIRGAFSSGKVCLLNVSGSLYLVTAVTLDTVETAYSSYIAHSDDAYPTGK